MDLYLYLLSTFLLGAIHALEPGHGKMLIVASIATSGGSLKDISLLSAVATLSHTITIIILVVLASVSAQYLPATLEHSMGLFAGVIILVVGIWMIFSTHKHICHCSQSKKKLSDKNFKELILLGVSGGIVPCPTSLAVFSTAVASGDTFRAMLLVVSFSLGLGVLLLVSGCVFLKASTFFQLFFNNQTFEKKAHRFTAYFISVLGIWLIAKELTDKVL